MVLNLIWIQLRSVCERLDAVFLNELTLGSYKSTAV